MKSFAINKRNVFYWTLYDFANSIVVIAFALYFSQWLVVEHKVADIWYNLTFVGASILLLLTAPVLARIADKKQSNMSYLRLMTLLMFISTLGASLLAIFDGNVSKFVILATICFLFSNYFYQFCLIFYNTLLNQLAPIKKQGLISGIGYAGNWLGQFAGVLIALPFAVGTLYWFGHSGRAQTLLPATLLFFALALPMLFLFKETIPPIKIKISLRDEYKNFIQSFIKILKIPGVGRFLLGFFFFNDAVITLETNFAIYLERVFNVNDQLKSLFLLSVLVGTTLGALLGGIIADKIGLKKSLKIVLAMTAVTVFLTGIANSFILFLIFSVGFGFFYGASLVITRTVLNYLAPTQEINHIYSYYSLIERFATFVGPVAWGLTILLLSKYEIISYKVAWLIMTIFIIFGVIIIRKIPSDRSLSKT